MYKKCEKNCLSNYIFISLTNTDYKIIAFLFAKRLQKVQNYLKNENQTTFIKGRFIGVNARLIQDILDFCKLYTENRNGILLFLDFEKAFDSVEWEFLYQPLKKFNIGENFIKLTKILYGVPVFKMKK